MSKVEGLKVSRVEGKPGRDGGTKRACGQRPFPVATSPVVNPAWIVAYRRKGQRDPLTGNQRAVGVSPAHGGS